MEKLPSIYCGRVGRDLPRQGPETGPVSLRHAVSIYSSFTFWPLAQLTREYPERLCVEIGGQGYRCQAGIPVWPKGPMMQI